MCPDPPHGTIRQSSQETSWPVDFRRVCHGTGANHNRVDSRTMNLQPNAVAGLESGMGLITGLESNRPMRMDMEKHGWRMEGTRIN
jgi:hypothetical protein